jgi:hypothetical protein
MAAQNQDILKLGEPISHSQSVPVSREDVWEVISRPGNLVDFHPFCESNPVEVWPGVGSKDKIYYYNGLVLEREFTAWIEGIGYDLTTTSENGMQFKVSWRITPAENNHSSLTLTISQVLKQGSERKMKQFSRLLKKYLIQVGGGFEYYLRTGERVRRNQFGSHRLFSSPVTKQENLEV